MRRARQPEIFVVTGVQPDTQEQRRSRYLALMLLRALIVPGVLLLPVPGTVQAALVLFAAATQLVAVIVANEPDRRGYHNPNAFAGTLPAQGRAELH